MKKNTLSFFYEKIHLYKNIIWGQCFALGSAPYSEKKLIKIRTEYCKQIYEMESFNCVKLTD